MPKKSYVCHVCLLCLKQSVFALSLAQGNQKRKKTAHPREFVTVSRLGCNSRFSGRITMRTHEFRVLDPSLLRLEEDQKRV